MVCPTCGLSAWWPVPGGRRCAICGNWEITASSHLDPVGVALSDPSETGKGQHHAGAGDTEEASARLVAPRTGTQRSRCLDAFAGAWPDGYTDEELAAETGLYRYSAAPRRGELLRGGWVVDSGRRRVGALKAEAIVWVLSPAAVDTLGVGGQGQMVLV